MGNTEGWVLGEVLGRAEAEVYLDKVFIIVSVTADVSGVDTSTTVIICHYHP